MKTTLNFYEVTNSKTRKLAYWKNLNAFTVPPVLANSVRRSSSATEGLGKLDGKKKVKINNKF